MANVTMSGAEYRELCKAVEELVEVKDMILKTHVVKTYEYKDQKSLSVTGNIKPTGRTIDDIMTYVANQLAEDDELIDIAFKGKQQYYSPVNHYFDSYKYDNSYDLLEYSDKLKAKWEAKQAEADNAEPTES